MFEIEVLLDGFCFLDRALLAGWVFRDMLGRGGGGNPTPANSAPKHRTVKQKSAFESSSEVVTKLFQYFFLRSIFRPPKVIKGQI